MGSFDVNHENEYMEEENPHYSGTMLPYVIVVHFKFLELDREKIFFTYIPKNHNHSSVESINRS